ncbi:MAG: hypothetical protein ACFE8U_04390 [Candidatus Hermodarchaeota archaeon]
MGSSEKLSEKHGKKPKNELYANVLEQIPKIIKQNIQQNIQVVREEIQNTSNDVRLMIRGIHAEIQEVKTLATSNKRLIEELARKTPLKKSTPEISSGLDLLEKIPHHLRRTYATVMKHEGSTAKEIAIATGKSRPLESDYLNQLSDLGWIFRKRAGKTVLFYSKPEDIVDEENNGLNPSAPIDFITSKKNQVKEASASSEKN